MENYLLTKKRKIVLVGCGSVGISFLYSSINRGIADEYILIDINKKREYVRGLIWDLEDAIAVSQRTAKIRWGSYSNDDIADASIIVIAAGVAQQVGEGRSKLLEKNAVIIKRCVEEINKTNFDGIIIVVTNPCDVMGYITAKFSNLSANKIIATGTLLDSYRMNVELARSLNVPSEGVESYILGEHGDSSCFVASRSFIEGKFVTDYSNESGSVNDAHMKVINKAYEIIERKGDTSYGIGRVSSYLCEMLFKNYPFFAVCSTLLRNGEYKQKDSFGSVPVVMDRNGVSEILKWSLLPQEEERLGSSFTAINENIRKLKEKGII